MKILNHPVQLVNRRSDYMNRESALRWFEVRSGLITIVILTGIFFPFGIMDGSGDRWKARTISRTTWRNPPLSTISTRRSSILLYIRTSSQVGGTPSGTAEMSTYRWKSFTDDGDRPEKPRCFGMTEIRGPHYSLFNQNLIKVRFFPVSFPFVWFRTCFRTRHASGLFPIQFHFPISARLLAVQDWVLAASTIFRRR